MIPMITAVSSDLAMAIILPGVARSQQAIGRTRHYPAQ